MPIGPECLHCWAAEQTHRRKRLLPARYGGLTDMQGRFNGKVRFMEKDLAKPLRRRKPTVYSIWNDLFHVCVAFFHRDWVMAMIHDCPQHTFLALTKRPWRMADWSKCRPRAGELPHLWIGTTAGTQTSADERLPHLLQCPAAVRFLSAEPLLEHLDITAWTWGPSIDRLAWLIIGPETGSRRRACEPAWMKSLIEQADAAKVPVFIKAFPMGGRISKDSAEWPRWARRREFPSTP